MKKDNQWQILKKYINKLEEGHLIERRTVLRFIYINLGEKYLKYTTIDNYLNYLKQANFLKTESPGKYRLVRHIPENLSLEIIKKVVYEVKWMIWFADPEDWCKTKNEVKNGR